MKLEEFKKNLKPNVSEVQVLNSLPRIPEKYTKNSENYMNIIEIYADKLKDYIYQKKEYKKELHNLNRFLIFFLWIFVNIIAAGFLLLYKYLTEVDFIKYLMENQTTFIFFIPMLLFVSLLIFMNLFDRYMYFIFSIFGVKHEGIYLEEIESPNKEEYKENTYKLVSFFIEGVLLINWASFHINKKFKEKEKIDILLDPSEPNYFVIKEENINKKTLLMTLLITLAMVSSYFIMFL